MSIGSGRVGEIESRKSSGAHFDERVGPGASVEVEPTHFAVLHAEPAMRARAPVAQQHTQVQRRPLGPYTRVQYTVCN